MLKKNRILIILVFCAVVLITASIVIRLNKPDDVVWEEISKVLMTLGASVVVGGLLKILLEDFKKEIQKDEKTKEFTKELVGFMRKVYDEVELSRILIESHKTAKTYGERIRDGIIPSKITLYDIKRGVYDREDFLEDDASRRKIRLSVHFMIAYLQSLIQEYQNEYFTLANLQAYQEEIKKKSRSVFASGIVNEKVSKEKTFQLLSQVNEIFDNNKEHVPKRPLTVWNEIDSLMCLKDFLNADRSSKYFRFFVSQYHYCKKLIRATKSTNRVSSPFPDLEDKYIKTLENNDESRSSGKYIPEFDLVMYIYENEFL